MSESKVKRYILLVTADEWNHDADEWLGIYVSDEEVMEAYSRATKWFDEERSKGCYCSAQKVAIYEYDIDNDIFREINLQNIFNNI